MRVTLPIVTSAVLVLLIPLVVRCQDASIDVAKRKAAYAKLRAEAQSDFQLLEIDVYSNYNASVGIPGSPTPGDHLNSLRTLGSPARADRQRLTEYIAAGNYSLTDFENRFGFEKSNATAYLSLATYCYIATKSSGLQSAELEKVVGAYATLKELDYPDPWLMAKTLQIVKSSLGAEAYAQDLAAQKERATHDRARCVEGLTQFNAREKTLDPNSVEYEFNLLAKTRFEQQIARYDWVLAQN